MDYMGIKGKRGIGDQGHERVRPLVTLADSKKGTVCEL